MFTVVDVTGLLLAALACVPLWLLPGYGVASLSGALGWRTAPSGERWCIALVLAAAALPALDSLIAQSLGLSAAIVVNVVLAAVGAAQIWRGRAWPRPSRGWAMVLLAWLAIVVVELVDFDSGARLYQSVDVIDKVKHAAVITSIEKLGLPLIDPFFFRPIRAGYYFFFYTVPAMSVRATGRLFDARAAFGGMVFWTGCALLALCRLLIERTGIVDPVRQRAVLSITAGLLACGGLGLIGMMLAEGTHPWKPQADWWSRDGASTWISSLLWVPQHVTGLIAAWVAFALLAGPEDGASAQDGPWPVRWTLAALAFATSVGASFWLAVPAALTAIIWLGALALESRWRIVARVVATGALALAICAPTLAGMLADRADAGLPIAVTIRGFPLWDMLISGEPTRSLGRVALLPVNLALDFGVFLLGAWMFWRRQGRATRPELSRVLTIGVSCSLVLAYFTRSTIIHNDLATRAVLFAQLGLLLWTASAFELAARSVAEVPPSVRYSFSQLPMAAGIALVVGYLGIAYSLVCARVPPVYFEPGVSFINSSPDVDRDLRAAYAWMNDHLPDNAVTQHNPEPTRVFDYGLYGRDRVGVSDRAAKLFGAADADVARRWRLFQAVFDNPPSCGAIKSEARTEGVDFLVATSRDPAWRDQKSWIWRTPAIYRNANVRVVPVANLQDQTEAAQ